ncbi:GNAT family N-acetyltransferase (plasmid) [Ensifer adhaerens]|uniref:GNAT family N-acetyltransferase n=1 Tax=Ensifer adhaerens TaxID=106592 RepID=UPI001CBE299B|nr:GNAT family N-acetyltransferase [Ensifer adhaerens]MBZ7927406.1 GNAT family N-acetyltransferase [Ensifer adhaerens]UAX97838.1 GNAT family N-acetyltransferase [Ensifer adhaerens]UAY05217.1 GNAT family N-acetyltransferase [Ensifer adhaerens]UAY12595.1 GNAT family N-acetyltransferase [Ensifer adhaerens]
MSTSITIRAARKGDMPVLGTFGTQLTALHHQWDPERFIATRADTKASYARWLQSQLEASDVVVLAAEQAEAIVGYAYASLEGYDYMALRGPAGVIHDLFVDPEHRNQGVGRMLVDAVIAELQRRGADLLVLSTAHRNEAAQRLFLTAGFRPTMVEMALGGNV